MLDIFEKDGAICIMPAAVYPKNHLSELREEIDLETDEWHMSLPLRPASRNILKILLRRKRNSFNGNTNLSRIVS